MSLALYIFSRMVWWKMQTLTEVPQTAKSAIFQLVVLSISHGGSDGQRRSTSQYEIEPDFPAT